MMIKILFLLALLQNSVGTGPSNSFDYGDIATPEALHIINESVNNNDLEPVTISTSNGVSLEDANMINYNVENSEITYEYFDQNSYAMRTDSTTSDQNNSNNNGDYNSSDDILFTETYFPEDIGVGISANSILGDDERVLVTNPKVYPYSATALIVSTFSFYDSNGLNRDVIGRGTGFLEGPNLLVTAGHCVYMSLSDYGIDSCIFANKIEVYAGFNGSVDTSNSSYSYYAEVEIINIQKEYYQNISFDFDWAACQLNWDLGNVVGYYGKISNWYEQGADVYSYGYPGSQSYTMWETHGNLTNSTNYEYNYDFDTSSGQSGSPVFMTTEDGSVYVCGIHTFGLEGSHNGGTRINSFIFHYLNSFVTYHNYEHSVGSISPDEYGFADAYPTDYSTSSVYKDHYTDKNFHFQTVRYRTGYIHNEYIVMSCIRKDINYAYIEYKFDTPISKLTVQLSHWREKSVEMLDKSTGLAVLQYWDNGWVNHFDLLADETNLPRDRTNPTTYTITFDEPVYRIQFFSMPYSQPVNDNNRGRICIGDITFYAKEGNI